MKVRYLNEFKLYINDKAKSSKRLRPQDKADLIINWDKNKSITLLKDLKIEERRIQAIRMVASGISPLHVSGEFSCSSETIKNWINTTYGVLLNAAKWYT